MALPNQREISEEQFLSTYDASLYDRPSTAVDSAIFTIMDDTLAVLMIQRGAHPDLAKWSLVGGYVNMESDLDLVSTARRKLIEKTALDCPYLEQVMTIGNATRDPRGWTISTAYFALLPWQEMELCAGNGALDIKWITLESIAKLDLAFDHKMILEKCLERLKTKALYTTLPVNLMQGDFTLSELQSVYETVLGKTIQAKSFRRRILGCSVIEETGESRATGKRPAKLYRLITNTDTHYFNRNLESVNL